ncbi:MAG TPA: hypothetical protein VFD48_14560 [Pyrinomonadaceae bacterium]|nr:hypothetical protein [Pyrinomonadaceae bacterium]
MPDKFVGLGAGLDAAKPVGQEVLGSPSVLNWLLAGFAHCYQATIDLLHALTRQRL